jgi:16S rRNA (guanine966-N2)-methyltransferase
VRVIAGTAKGRKLLTCPGSVTRPTPARVREALFSMLAGFVALHGAHILDLFAGSGAMGIEALSRGAAHATFVERDRAAQAVLRRNLMPFAERAHLCAMPAAAALKHLSPRAFDIVLLDPPYQAGLLTPTLAALQQGQFVAADGAVVCEYASRSAAPVPPQGFVVARNRRFGDVSVQIMRPVSPKEPIACPL